MVVEEPAVKIETETVINKEGGTRIVNDLEVNPSSGQGTGAGTVGPAGPPGPPGPPDHLDHQV